MDSPLTYHELSGAALTPWLDQLGSLRIAVFREYPYLYDGSLEYEREYLQAYVKSARSLVVLVRDGSRDTVGATTCIPLADEGPEFQEPFIKSGWDVNDVCYFGESLLLQPWRGRGIGREFFDRREAHARKLGFPWTAFCSVDRPPDHPMRPADYRPLDKLWLSRGYSKNPDLKASFAWKEIGEKTDSAKSLTFWTKSWRQPH